MPSASMSWLASQRGRVIVKCAKVCVIQDVPATDMVIRYGGDATLVSLAERLGCPKCGGSMELVPIIPWNPDEHRYGVQTGER